MTFEKVRESIGLKGVDDMYNMPLFTSREFPVYRRDDEHIGTDDEYVLNRHVTITRYPSLFVIHDEFLGNTDIVITSKHDYATAPSSKKIGVV